MPLAPLDLDTLTRPSAGLAAADVAIDDLVEAAIAAAPECLRRRVILQAVDWGAVPPHKVGLLLSSLAQARLAMPRWLARALLLAGHTLPAEAEPALPAALVLLNRLNNAGGEPYERTAIAPLLAALADVRELDADVAAALVRRLVALSWDEEALRLALAQSHRVPAALKHAEALLARHAETLPGVRLRLSGFSTTHTLAEVIGPAFAARGWRALVSESSFGAALADLMNPPEDADALAVLLDLEGLMPQDARATADAGLLDRQADLLADALAAFSARAGVPLLINTLPVPAAPTAGLIDRRHALGLRRAVDTVNARLLDAAEQQSHIVVIDSDQALAALPLAAHADPRLWYYGRIAYSAEATRHLAHAFAEAWRLLKRGPAKVLAVDLDNTLWGGVYGDDGIERLACGEEFPGNAFQALQRECLRLRAEGMLLVALSKNNPDALSVFARHPGMLLKADDFAAHAINWEPKPDNLRRLAAELNLGLDSVVFLDDSPHERAAMRRLLPEVLVPEMPADPAERPSWLRRLTATWPVRLTAEDAARADLYAAERKARAARAGAATLADYLTGLEQRLVLSRVDERTLARAAQMHQRTNQFNLTTRRLTEAEIAALMAEGRRGLAVVGRVADTFGDHGLVAAATVEIAGEEAVIRTLLMSCRVIGRDIERAFVGALIGALRDRGIARVRGEYLPTPKNAMVRDLYASLGFEREGGSDDGPSTWAFAVGREPPPASPYVTVSWES